MAVLSRRRRAPCGGLGCELEDIQLIHSERTVQSTVALLIVDVGDLLWETPHLQSALLRGWGGEDGLGGLFVDPTDRKGDRMAYSSPVPTNEVNFD
jgi:hypothetical protein